MSYRCLIDANIVLRHILQDHEDDSLKADAFFEQLENGGVEGEILEPVVLEIVFTLERSYKMPRAQIQALLKRIFANSGVVFAGEEEFEEVFALYVREPSLSLVDCYIAVIAIASGISNVASFDKKIARVPGVNRFDPPARL